MIHTAAQLFEKAQSVAARHTSLVAACCAVILSAAPILDPYIIVEIGSSSLKVMDFLAVLIGLAALFCRKEELWETRSLLLLVASLGVLSIVSCLFVHAGQNWGNSIKILLIFLFRSLLFINLVSVEGVKSYYPKCILMIGLAASVLVLLQQIFMSFFGGPLWDGILPLRINDTDAFQSLRDVNTGAIRPRAFFQEPSYFAIYVTAASFYAVRVKRHRLLCVFFIALIISTSFIGFVGAVLVGIDLTLAWCKSEAGFVRHRLVLCSAVVLAALVIFTLLALNGVQPFEGIFLRISGKVRSIFDIGTTYSWGRSSAQLRLLGNIGLLKQYEPLELIIGFGWGQYQTIFASQIDTGYSSTFVNVVLNCGIAGAIVLVAWIASLFKIRSPLERVGLTAFFATCLFCDNIFFNWYFLFLLSACLLMSPMPYAEGLSRESGGICIE